MAKDKDPRREWYGHVLILLCRMKPWHRQWPRRLAELYQFAPDEVRKPIAAIMVHRFGIRGDQREDYLPMIFREAHFRELQVLIGKGASPFEFTRGEREVTIIIHGEHHARRIAA